MTFFPTTFFKTSRIVASPIMSSLSAFFLPEHVAQHQNGLLMACIQLFHQRVVPCPPGVVAVQQDNRPHVLTKEQRRNVSDQLGAATGRYMDIFRQALPSERMTMQIPVRADTGNPTYPPLARFSYAGRSPRTIA